MNPPPDKNSDNVQKDPVFYYSREHRLSRASPIVQSMNESKSKKSGLLNSFFGNKANVMAFFTIVLICLIFIFGSRFSVRESAVKLGGNTVALTVLSGEATFLKITRKAPKSGEIYIGPVDLAVSPVVPGPKEGEAKEEPRVFTHRIYFNLIESEIYQISLPFAGNDFLVLLRTDSEQKSVRVKAAGSSGGRK